MDVKRPESKSIRVIGAEHDSIEEITGGVEFIGSNFAESYAKF